LFLLTVPQSGQGGAPRAAADLQKQTGSGAASVRPARAARDEAAFLIYREIFPIIISLSDL
jgi:hypothetical protein